MKGLCEQLTQCHTDGNRHPIVGGRGEGGTGQETVLILLLFFPLKTKNYRLAKNERAVGSYQQTAGEIVNL